MASLFLGGADDLSSSCPTSQEPTHTVSVPQVFQTAEAALQFSGSMYPSHPYRPGQGQVDDPRSHSERRVSIQTPSQDDQSPSADHSGTLTDRQLLARSLSQGPPQAAQREEPPLEMRYRYDSPNDQARAT